MTVRGILTHLYHQPRDAFYYVQGILRYRLYKSKLRFLLRWHIIDQYEWRKVEAQPCYYAGECQCCGCRTPELFFCGKACSAGKAPFSACAMAMPCYPALMSQTEWYWFQVALRS